MPIDVDNGLPGIELWFGREEADEVGMLCHMDTCAAMNTGNRRFPVSTAPDRSCAHLAGCGETL